MFEAQVASVHQICLLGSSVRSIENVGDNVEISSMTIIDPSINLNQLTLTRIALFEGYLGLLSPKIIVAEIDLNVLKTRTTGRGEEVYFAQRSLVLHCLQLFKDLSNVRAFFHEDTDLVFAEICSKDLDVLPV